MPGKDNLILTAVGPDQIGLVEKISQFIAQHALHPSLQQSSQTHKMDVSRCDEPNQN